MYYSFNINESVGVDLQVDLYGSIGEQCITLLI